MSNAFFCKNFSNSELIKYVPLSVIMVSGKPNLLNVVLSSCITTVDVAEAVSFASIHLECASISMRNIRRRNGPAKSKFNHAHGHVSQLHGFKGVASGVD